MKAMRKFFAMLLAFTMCVSPCAVYAASSFSDVAGDAWYATCVDYCEKNDIMIGLTTQTFAPEENMSRAMLVLTLYRIAGKPAVSGEMPFVDVESSHYAYDAILWAKNAPVIYGIDESHFYPDKPVTREDAACIIARYVKMIDADFLDGPVRELAFVDGYEISDYAKASVSLMAETSLMSGDPQGTFRPASLITRAEAASLLMRLDQALMGKENAVLRVIASGGSKTETTLSSATTETLRVILNNFDDATGWKYSDLYPEYVGTHEIVLDDVTYVFERYQDGTTSYDGFRYINSNDGSYGAAITENTELLAELDAILFG